MPSRRVLLACEETPFMYTVMARWGLPASELASLLPDPIPAPGGARPHRLMRLEI